MLGEEDYAEACRRYKDRRTKLPERQRYHGLILATQGYSYREIGRILLVDEESTSQWVALYQATGLDGLKNHPSWGGEHRQRFLQAAQLEELKQRLAAEAMPGTKAGSGWTAKAIRKLIRDRYNTSYSKSGVRKLLAEIGGSYQPGRKLRKQGTVVLYSHGQAGVDLSVLNGLQYREPVLVSPVGGSGGIRQRRASNRL